MSCGVPVTVTTSLNSIVIAITSPVRYLPLSVVEETDETVGTAVSIIIALLAAREPAPPGVGNVKYALRFSESLIVPLLSASALDAA